MYVENVLEVLPDFIILILVYFLVFFKRWRTRGRDTLFVNTLMYIYLSCVLYFTLMPIITALPFIFDHPYVPMNLEPFIDVTLGRGNATQQIILNIIMTIPFGFLVPLVDRKRPAFLKTVFYTFLLSFSIETIQPLLSSLRSSDITDLITNIVGGVIGYLAFIILRPLVYKVLTHITGRSSQTSSHAEH